MQPSRQPTLQPDRRRSVVIDASDKFQRPTQVPTRGIVAAIGICTAAIAAAIAINGKEVPPESPLGQQLQPLANAFTETVSDLSSATTNVEDPQSGQAIQDLEERLHELTTQRDTLIAQAGCDNKATWTYSWMSGDSGYSSNLDTNVNWGCDLR